MQWLHPLKGEFLKKSMAGKLFDHYLDNKERAKLENLSTKACSSSTKLVDKGMG